jgi:hypothetical protein
MGFRDLKKCGNWKIGKCGNGEIKGIEENGEKIE